VSRVVRSPALGEPVHDTVHQRVVAGHVELLALERECDRNIDHGNGDLAVRSIEDSGDRVRRGAGGVVALEGHDAAWDWWPLGVGRDGSRKMGWV